MDKTILYNGSEQNMSNIKHKYIRRIHTLLRSMKRREERNGRRIPDRSLYMFLLPTGAYIKNGTVFLDGECLGTVHEVVNNHLSGRFREVA